MKRPHITLRGFRCPKEPTRQHGSQPTVELTDTSPHTGLEDEPPSSIGQCSVYLTTCWTGGMKPLSGMEAVMPVSVPHVGEPIPELIHLG